MSHKPVYSLWNKVSNKPHASSVSAGLWGTTFLGVKPPIAGRWGPKTQTTKKKIYNKFFFVREIKAHVSRWECEKEERDR